MKRVLVTGAMGNIGAITVELLVSRGYAVRALDLGTAAQRERGRATLAAMKAARAEAAAARG